MKELSLREIQLGELGVLKRFDAICREQGLKYFLFYGTLIGAVRHGGFIPWDDDVDVVMPRPDYEKFQRWWDEHGAQEKPLKLMNTHTNRDYIYSIARLCDTRYQVDYSGAKEYGLGLFMDIYPLDGYGSSEEEAAGIYQGNLNLIRMALLAGSDHFESSKQGLLRTPAKFAAYLYAKARGVPHFIRKLEQRAKQRPYETNAWVGCSSWESNAYPREDLEETMEMRFEDQTFLVPAAYDRILRRDYGDYMQLPPEEDRIGHHYYKAYLREETKEEESR